MARLRREGLITQSAVTDYLGVPRLQSNTSYSARGAGAHDGTLTQGTLHVQLYSVIQGISTPAFPFRLLRSLRVVYGIYRAITPWGLPYDSVGLASARVCDGTPTSGAGFIIENIEIFPTAEPYNASLVRASFAEDPESYDGVSGFLSVSENDGQTVRAAFCCASGSTL